VRRIGDAALGTKGLAHAAAVGVVAPVIGEQSESAADGRVRVQQVRETDARKNRVVHRLLQVSAAVRVRGPEPDTAQRVRRGVLDLRIKARLVTLYFAPASLNLVAQSKVESQVRLDLVVILDEELWQLFAS